MTNQCNDKFSDIYSFGITFSPLFEGETAQSASMEGLVECLQVIYECLSYFEELSAS